jgi:hypothetical protein
VWVDFLPALIEGGYRPIVVDAQAFGMMGWRVGYIAYPEDSGLSEDLGAELTKVRPFLAVSIV